MKSSKFKVQSSKLKIDQVKHIAELAGFKLPKEEVRNYQRWLSETLDYVQILNAVETKNVKPTAQVAGLENIFREDEPGNESLTQASALSNTSSRERGFFKIKKIL